jgi:hypothetical protein
MGRYSKAAVAVAGAIAIALYSALNGDDHVSTQDAIQIAIAAWAAFQVWLTANIPGSTHAKAITAGMLAALNLLVSQLTGGIDSAEWVNLIIAFATAAGVWGVRNNA